VKKIEKGKKYKVKGSSEYFKKKYGTSNPEIRVEDTDENIWGKSWMVMDGNPAAIIFAMRTGTEGIKAPLTETVYCGKISPLGSKFGLSELVFESELEEIKENENSPA